MEASDGWPGLDFFAWDWRDLVGQMRSTRPAPPLELKETRLTANPSENGVSLACISPDGKYLAYSDQRRLYLKLIESGEVRPIPQPEGLTAENTSWMVGRWFPDGTRFLAHSV